MNEVKFFLVLLTLIGLAQVSRSATIINGQYSTNSWSSTAWASDISSTDLINSGQSSLSSYNAPDGFFSSPKGSMNDGASSYASLSDNIFYGSAMLPVVATYNLDISVNTLGYDITSISTFMGWYESSVQQANQIYTVDVSFVGSSDYTSLSSINYTPFGSGEGSYHYSYVEIAEDSTGILATGVDSIRFTFSSPGGGGNNPGTVIRELDVYGSPVAVPEPATFAFMGIFGAGAFAIRRIFMM